LVRYTPEISVIECDLEDSASLMQITIDSSPDFIYNLGGFTAPGDSWDHQEEVRRINVGAVEALLNAMRKLPKQARMFQASSALVFEGVDRSPQTEAMETVPKSPYARSKADAMALVREARRPGPGLDACRRGGRAVLQQEGQGGVVADVGEGRRRRPGHRAVTEGGRSALALDQQVPVLEAERLGPDRVHRRADPLGEGLGGLARAQGRGVQHPGQRPAEPGGPGGGGGGHRVAGRAEVGVGRAGPRLAVADEDDALRAKRGGGFSHGGLRGGALSAR
jgi:hypothetical protein